ncbi:hypothetical protein NP493_1030g00008 [Ridgeia piscesae]|uniref:Uncharacterized protein n=1 Tax=Ridgeia piscesae TaxID=27915 RepID=A0AAD9KIG4_RIDPI|nr:hypothetical protein NP493_1030g00008 [Ridgeia piscesae]
MIRGRVYSRLHSLITTDSKCDAVPERPNAATHCNLSAAPSSDQPRRQSPSAMAHALRRGVDKCLETRAFIVVLANKNSLFERKHCRIYVELYTYGYTVI